MTPLTAAAARSLTPPGGKSEAFLRDRTVRGLRRPRPGHRPRRRPHLDRPDPCRRPHQARPDRRRRRALDPGGAGDRQDQARPAPDRRRSGRRQAPAPRRRSGDRRQGRRAVAGGRGGILGRADPDLPQDLDRAPEAALGRAGRRGCRRWRSTASPPRNPGTRGAVTPTARSRPCAPRSSGRAASGSWTATRPRSRPSRPSRRASGRWASTSYGRCGGPPATGCTATWCASCS